MKFVRKTMFKTAVTSVGIDAIVNGTIYYIPTTGVSFKAYEIES